MEMTFAKNKKINGSMNSDWMDKDDRKIVDNYLKKNNKHPDNINRNICIPENKSRMNYDNLMDKDDKEKLDTKLNILKARIRNKNMFQRGWKNKGGKVAILIMGGLVVLTAVYAVAAGIVSATSGVTENKTVRVLPFNNVSKFVPGDIYYNNHVDNRLQFLTATVAIELRNLCNSNNPISWDVMKNVLAQCSALEKNEKDNEVNVTGTFVGEFSDTAMKTWLYNFLKENDMDVFDAARIHDDEINEVIDFVKNSSTHNLLTDHVFNSYDLLDIGMIRFPTKTEPYIKLYRLQLTGLFSGSSFMTVSRNVSRSISASVYSCKYLPRDDLLERLPPDMIKNTLVKFEHMLN
jgi:hypothetical protein